MKKSSWRILMCCCLAAIVGIAGLAQTTDGPYYIVDSSAPAWGNVFATLADALAFINTPPNVEERAGATIILYPGVHDVGTVSPAAIVINVPGLRLVSRDGANRTIIRATAAVGADVLTITAPGVVIEGVTIQTTVGLNGIGVSARDCTLRDITVQGAAGFVGINVLPGADNLLLDTVKCVGGANGIQVGLGGSVYDVVVQDSSVRAATVNCINLIDAQRIVIDSSSMSGSIGSGLNVGAACFNIEVTNCRINDDATNGLNAAAASGLNVDNCSFVGNSGFSVNLVGTVNVVVSNCAFEETGGFALQLSAGCSDVSILDNTMSRETSGPFTTNAVQFVPPAPAATDCQVKNNVITGYSNGINFATGSAPRNILIVQNTISDTLGDGISILSSGGGNVTHENTLLGCGGNGINILVAASDSYEQNVVTACTLSGMVISDTITSAVASLRIVGNTVSESGVDGIALGAIVPGLGVGGVTIADNELSGNDDKGISVNWTVPFGAPTGVIGNLRIENNLIADNEQQGLWFANAPGCVITGNTITGNLQQGILGTHAAAGTRILQNSVYDNAEGGIAINWTGAGNLVIEENLFVGNEGFAVSLTGPSVPVGVVSPLPYPFGMSLALNWWGSPTGPAGFFGGTGNALLGVSALSINAVAPVLTAPPIASANTKMPIVEFAQVAVIPSFAASKVTVNRLDSSGVQIAFSEVESRASGLVSTGAFTDYALENVMPETSGLVVTAVSVLISGFDTGIAEVALAFDPEELDGQDSAEPVLMALEDATWVFDEEGGAWSIEGGTWLRLNSCLVPGANLISAEIPVPELRGNYLALALVMPSRSTE